MDESSLVQYQKGDILVSECIFIKPIWSTDYFNHRLPDEVKVNMFIQALQIALWDHNFVPLLAQDPPVVKLVLTDIPRLLYRFGM